VLYAHRDGAWYRFGHHLPAFGLPQHEGRPLFQVLTPAPCLPVPVPTETLSRTTLRLVTDDRPRSTTALVCDLAALVRWAETAVTARLTTLQAARRGAQVLLRGKPLPPLPDGERFWGNSVLVPLGWRIEPDLPESALREAFEVEEGDVLLVRRDGVEPVASDAFRPLTRAAVRLAQEERP
jgi:hypothetical protein